MYKKTSTKHLVIATAIAIVTMVVYAGNLYNDFVFDDRLIVVENPVLQLKNPLAAIFTTSYWSDSESGLFRPLITASFALSQYFFGINTYGYHFLNNLIHAMNSGLIVVILIMIGLPVEIAAITALLFGTSAVHIETVSLIVGRADLLATFFLLVATFLLLKSMGRYRIIVPSYLCSIASYSLAFFCKESVLTGFMIFFPLVIVVGKRSVRHSFNLIGPFFLGIVFYFFLKFFLGLRLTSVDYSQYFHGIPYVDRFRTMIIVVVEYILMPFKPLPYLFDYSPQTIATISSWSDPTFLRAAGILIALLLPLAVWPRRLRGISYCLWAMFVLALPILQIIPIGALMAHRFFYLPSIAFFVIPAMIIHKVGGAFQKSRSGRNFNLIAFCILLCLVWVDSLIIQYVNRAIRTERSFWEFNYIQNERSYKIAVNYAIVLLNEGDLLIANHIANHLVTTGTEQAAAQMILGTIATKEGMRNTALDHFQKAYRLNADRQNTYNLAVTLLHLGDLEGSLGYARQLVEHYPLFPDYHYLVGNIDEALGRLPSAIQEYQRAMKGGYDPGMPLKRLGIIYLRMKEPSKARQYFESSLALTEEDDGETLYNLGCLAFLGGDFKKALLYFEQAWAMGYRNKKIEENLSRSRKAITDQ